MMNKLPVNPHSFISTYKPSREGVGKAPSASIAQHPIQAAVYQGRLFGTSSSPRPARPNLTRKQGTAWLSKKTANNSKPKTRSKKSSSTPIDTNEDGYEDPEESQEERASSSLSGSHTSEYAQQQHQQSWGGNEDRSDDTEKNTKELAVAKSRFKKRASGYSAQFLSTAPVARSSLSRSFADQLAKSPANASPDFIAKLYITAVITACNQVARPVSESNKTTTSKEASTLRANIHMLTVDACQAMPSRSGEASPNTLENVRTWLIEAQKNIPPTTITPLSKTTHLLMAPLILNLKKQSKPDAARLKNLTITAVQYS